MPPLHPTLQLAAELYAIGILLIVSLSHIAVPALWCRLFQDALKHPAAGIVIGLITLLFSLPILIAHWRWTWDLRSIVTVIAWGACIKGTLYLIRPSTFAQVAARHVQHPGRFVLAGIVGVALALLALGGVITSGELTGQ